jgi:hypothetical protein
MATDRVLNAVQVHDMLETATLLLQQKLRDNSGEVSLGEAVIAMDHAQAPQSFRSGHKWAQHVIVAVQQRRRYKIAVEVIRIPGDVINAGQLGVEKPGRQHVSQMFH